MSDKYILTDDGRVKPATLLEWAKFFESDKRMVQRETVNGADVSTVFLGLDHRFGDDGPPLVFETMVFGGLLDQSCERYSTLDEAKAGHKAMCERVLTETHPQGPME